MPSYLVLGLPKTGTSALYASIKQACDPLSVYEPNLPSQVAWLLRQPAPAKLAKVLLPAFPGLGVTPESFDKTVLIVRDPRDALVSWLLYRPLLPRNCGKKAFVSDFLAALRKKEADPASTSMLDLLAVLDAHGVAHTRPDELRDHHRLLLEFDASSHPHVTVRYEDYVDGNLGALPQYLALDLRPRSRLGKHLVFNERSKSYGAWKHWLVPSDVEYYEPLLRDCIAKYGYEREWRPADHPIIDPGVSSGHVQRQLERLERLPNQYGHLKPLEVYMPEYLEVLQSAIGDGAEAAMIELALAHKYGFGVPRSMETAVRLLEDAVDRGNPLASVHLGVLLERGDGVPRDEERAKLLFWSAARTQGNPRTRRQMTTVRARYPAEGEPTVTEPAVTDS